MPLHGPVEQAQPNWPYPLQTGRGLLSFARSPRRRKAAWVLRSERLEIEVSVEVAETLWARTVGLLGRSGVDGVMLLLQTRWIHTVGMRFSVDVAYLDRSLRVVDVVAGMRPWRVGRPRRCWAVLEAGAGTFEHWGLEVGDQLRLGVPTRPGGRAAPFGPTPRLPD